MGPDYTGSNQNLIWCSNIEECKVLGSIMGPDYSGMAHGNTTTAAIIRT